MNATGQVEIWRKGREFHNAVNTPMEGARLQFWTNPPADLGEGIDWWVKDVHKIVDGDTMTFGLYRSLPPLVMDGEHHITLTEHDCRRVRVAIIDTPEVNRKETAAAGRAAKEAAGAWLLEGHLLRKLKVVTYRLDRLSRYLGTPYRIDQEESLPSYMLRTGFAVLWS